MQKKKIKEAFSIQEGAKTELYPSLDINAMYGYDKRFHSHRDGSYDFYETRLILSKDIYTGGKISGKIQRVHLLWEIEKLEMISLIEDLIYDTSKTFYDILYYKQKIINVQEYIDILKTDYSQINQRFKVGDASRFELIMSKVKFTEQQNILLSYQADLDKAKKDLFFFMDFKQEDRLTIQGDLKQLLNKNNENHENNENGKNSNQKVLTDKIIKDLTSMKILSSNQAVIKQEMQIERSLYKPEITAELEFYNTNRGLSFDDFGGHDNALSAVVIFTLPILQYIKSKPVLEEKKHAYASIVEDKKITTNEILNNMRNALLDKTKGNNELTIAKENMNLLKDAMEMVRQAYSSGTMTLLDVQQVTLSYILSRMNYNNVIYELVIADLDLKKARGELITDQVNYP